MKRTFKAMTMTYSAETVVMFPGQGAQYVGMGAELVKEFPETKEYFDEASEVLGYDLLEKCQNGPKEVLDSTDVSQPAIFTCSMAALVKAKAVAGEDIEKATVTCGLSLGEYSALCFAGAISFADGVKITKARGEAMQAASDETNGGMVSVIGLSSDVVSEICSKASETSGKPVAVANYLCTGNYAVSGAKEACAVVSEIAKPEFKARMTVPLAVAGAFHTDFMSSAVPRLQEVLDSIEIKSPRIPVISNVDAEPHTEGSDFRDLLLRQVTNPVRWETSMQGLLSNGYGKGYEVGPGKVLSGIFKRIDKKATAIVNIEA